MVDRLVPTDTWLISDSHLISSVKLEYTVSQKNKCFLHWKLLNRERETHTHVVLATAVQVDTVQVDMSQLVSVWRLVWSYGMVFIACWWVRLTPFTSLSSTLPFTRCHVSLKEVEYQQNCFCVVDHYSGAQRYEQFFQIGWLYPSSILLGLALCVSTTSVVSSIFVCFMCFCYIIYITF